MNPSQQPMAIVALVLATIAIAGCASTAMPTGVAVENREPSVGTAFLLKEVDVPPRPVFQVRPRFPAAFRKAGVEGLAVMEFVVDETGHTTNIVARRATDAAFAEAAKVALAQWVFVPAKKGGVQVACRMQVPMKFSISSQ